MNRPSVWVTPVLVPYWPGIDHRPAGRAGAGGDGVVAQQRRVPAQGQQAGEELGVRVVGVVLALEAQDPLQRLGEARLGPVGEPRKAVLVAGDQQDVGPGSRRVIIHLPKSGRPRRVTRSARYGFDYTLLG